MGKYEQLATDVLRGVGGESNVASVSHCATRLRFQLKDRDKADKAAVESTRGVITVVEAGGQFQVVIGNAVGQVYEALTETTTVPVGEGGAQGGLLSRAIELITSIFTPFLWVLAGTGLLKALLAVAVRVAPEWATTPSYAILFAASDAVFQFLPILIAVTAAKRFKANPFTSIAIAGALIYSATIAVIPGPDGATLTLQDYAATGGQLTFFGIPVVMTAYLSSVIPTVLAVFAQARLERVLNRVIPEVFRNFATPLLTIAIIVPLTFLVIGPVADLLGSSVSSGVNTLWALSPAIGGLIMGALWQVFVIFGLHWGFVPVIVQDLTEQGYSLLTGPLFAAVLAQAAATFAVFIKTRNKELKEVAGPAGISAFLAGITEPAIYGVTLRLKRPFVYGVIGGAVGGAIAAAGGSAAEGFVLPGAITLTSTLNVGNFTLQLIGTGVAMLIAFVLTLTLGFKDLPASQPAAGTEADPGAVESNARGIAAPVAGQVVPLAAVPDKVFSTGALGDGLAVIPSDGTVHAPVNGTLTVVMPHAYGVTTADGMEVLVHVGLDTVQLEGRHFSPQVTQGAEVRQGDVLVEYDVDAVTAAGFNPMVVVVVTNASQFAAVVPMTEGVVARDELVLDVVS
jgi:beta-glucoside PTS system EIICBA component